MTKLISSDVSGVVFDIATCAAQPGSDGGVSLRFLPVGEFKPADGRKLPCGRWVLTQERGRQIAAALNARQTPRVIDYEHQTLNAAENGEPAPASGWCRPGSWEMRADGLYTIVDWVAKAAAYIEAKEYRFFSPTFLFDKVSGAVTGVLHGALTNDPALDGFTEVYARAAAKFTSDHDEDEPMKFSALLIKLLGLAADANEDQITAALTALQARIDQDGATVAAANRTIVAVLDLRNQDVAALKAKAEKPDASQFVPTAVLTSTQTELASARARIVELEKTNSGAEVDALVAAGLKDGRLLKSTEQWARDLGKADIAQLKSFLEKQPKLEALQGQQTDGADVDASSEELTADEKAMCKNMGITEEAYFFSKTGKKKGAQK